MLRNWFRNFMIGRYGPDQLYFFLFVLSLILTLLSRILHWNPLYFAALALLILAILRMFSRNIPRRRAENDRFLRYWGPVKRWFRRRITRLKDSRTHRFFRCPSCKNTLRVPKGKGKVQITCPKCGQRFTKKT